MTGVLRQLRDNGVAITSLAVALSALGYNTWRNEVTERNRNIRAAGIELIAEIGSLQQIVFHAHYGERADDGAGPDPRGGLRMGWVDVFTINDLAALMPPEVAQDAGRLRAVWEADVAELIESKAAFRRIDGAIEKLRATTLAAMAALE